MLGIWYVARCSPGKEEDAGKVLAAAGLSPLLPKRAYRYVAAGRITERLAPLLAGYVLAVGEMTAARWHSCVDGNSYAGGAPGVVRGFLGNDGPDRPWSVIGQDEVDLLLKNCDSDAVLRAPAAVQRRRFRPGRRVRLISGALAGYVATVRRDDGRTVVLRLDSGWPAHVAPETCVGA